MNKILLLFIIIIQSVSILAAENNIRAIVNHQTITIDELLMRKQVTRVLNGIEQLSAKEEKEFSESILRSMINELIVRQTAEQMGLGTSTQEINEYVSNIEQSNKMPAGYMKENLPQEMYQDFTDKIAAGILRNQIISRVVAPTIKVSRNSIEEIAILAGNNDADIKLYIASAPSVDPKNLKHMQSVRDKLFAFKCFDPNNESTIKGIQRIDSKLSQLDAKQYSITRDLEVGQTSAILQNDGQFQVMKLCAKNLSNFSDEEQQEASAVIGNQKLQTQVERYFRALYKRSYIEIK